jgi:hypothetical protein
MPPTQRRSGGGIYKRRCSSTKSAWTSGYLLKKGGTRFQTKWQRRFFVLTDSGMTYYAEEVSSARDDGRNPEMVDKWKSESRVDGSTQ